MRLQCLTLFGLLCLVGCGGSPKVDLLPVEGIAKINGQPAGNLIVQFSPTKWPENVPMVTSTGVTDENGKFTLMSSDGRPGAPAGKHKVTIVDKNLETEDEPDGKSKKTPKNRVPNTYLSATTTPIEITVEANKKEYEVQVR